MSVPCEYNKVDGVCGNPSENGRCETHRPLHCSGCYNIAVKECGHVKKGNICMSPLCGDCQHSLMPDDGHVTKTGYEWQKSSLQHGQDMLARIREAEEPFRIKT